MATIRRQYRTNTTQDKSFADIQRDCLSKRILYEDPEFPANDMALYYSRQSGARKPEWKRPKDICKDPKLYVDGASRLDVKLGGLGDGWLLAAITSLSLSDSLLHRVVPTDQSFEASKYAGVFHFKICQYGKWVDVIVDDLLPTYDGKLLYLHSPEKNEFWCALLEKAYAKLNGSYEALKGGNATEAMEDFTGGVADSYELKKAPPTFTTMMKCMRLGALMTCEIEASDASKEESKLPNGLVMSYPYSVTGITKVSRTVQLIRLRNPSGDAEWTGDWGDKSAKWRMISDAEKRKIELDFNLEDGEFWMSFEDFCSEFTKLDICNLGPAVLADTNSDMIWKELAFDGEWVRGASAGGCRNNIATFASNPQFRLTLNEKDDNPDDDVDGCNCLISLVQKDRRKLKRRGLGFLTIGYVLYKIPDKQSSDKLGTRFFQYNTSAAKSVFSNTRGISERFLLQPGHYVIVPSTFDPNESGQFVLRIYTEKLARASEMDSEVRVDKDISNPKRSVDIKLESQFRKMFDELAGKDGEIDSYELQAILATSIKAYKHSDGLDMESCRTLIALKDKTKSGKLNLGEFVDLWLTVGRLLKIYKTYDKDQNGTFDSYELREGLVDAGFRLSNKMIIYLCNRYANQKLKIVLADFILMVMKLQAAYKDFQSYQDGQRSDVSLTLDQWIDTITKY